ncbi:MAG: signal peptide peptidase SppA [Desulfopila sp.]
MKDLVFSIFNILRHAGRIISSLRNFIFNTVLLAVIALLVVASFVSGPPTIPSNGILKLTLAGDIVEERRRTPPLQRVLAKALDLSESEPYTVLQDILDVIHHGATDPAIRAILLDLHDLGAIGFDQMRAIGKELTAFRQKGKKVYAAEDFYTQKQYYLAAYADTIITNPMGGVELHGFGVYPLYFKDALEKLQVNYHIFRVGAYKSAIEPIARTSMSPEARGQNMEWLAALWNTFVHDIATQRQLSNQAITAYIDDINTNLAAAGGDTAQLARNSRLVDRILTHQGVYSFLRAQNDGRDPVFVSTSDYLATITPSYTTDADDTLPKIGIIVAEGKILGGDQPIGVIGSDSLGKQLQKARNAPDIRGVVLRINSGGGSAFASEIIRQEILELRKSGKIVVISMGSVTASGGYWISANSDQIWASPVTITGSIGIFGAVPTFEKSLANLGIYSDGVGTTKFAAGINLAQPLNPELQDAIQQTLDNGYDHFLTIVEKGRKIDRTRLSSIAEGRVFAGKQAMALGLVDQLGSLDDAIAAAARLAGVTRYTPVYIFQERSLGQEFLEDLSACTTLLFPQLLDSAGPHTLYRQLKKRFDSVILMNDPHHLYAYTLLQPAL